MKKFEEAPVLPPLDDDQIFVNDKYQVNVKNLTGGWRWLSIKRKDKRRIKDWRELQQIKNAICGEEYEAVELYPAESRLVDTSNQFHLFVLPEGSQFPFGYMERMVCTGDGKIDEFNTRQRPFKHPPKDALTAEEVIKKTITQVRV